MKKILIDKQPWQTRVAILREDKLQDIYFHSESKIYLERSFFKGKVAKVLPGIQTAFVDIGQQRAGFLHITEIDRALATEKTAEFLQIDDNIEQQAIEKKLKKEISIEKILKEGDSILVQVLKEPVYEKGAKLTTCFTLPGKFLVLMPNIEQIGVSKKIENREERSRLKELINNILPAKMGAIIRTTAQDRKERDIKKDLAFLVSNWRSILKRFKKAQVGEKIYEDLPITIRTIREHLDEDVFEVITNDKKDQKTIGKFVKYYTPELSSKIKLHEGLPTLFEIFNVEKQIELAMHKKVLLKSGGSLIIETAEAMTVIDVNTGKFTGHGKMEDTILKTNLEAAEEIVTQLRLRNIGGLIVIDFIDMASYSNKQKLSKFFEKMLKERDKYQSVILKISEFGLVQMTRKRSGKSLIQQLTKTCPTCNSYGFVKSENTIAYELLENLKEEIIRKNLKGSIVFSINTKIFNYLIHNEYKSILKLEEQLNVKIILEDNTTFEENTFKIHTEQA